jgi:hypothetical protein
VYNYNVEIIAISKNYQVSITVYLLSEGQNTQSPTVTVGQGVNEIEEQ